MFFTMGLFWIFKGELIYFVHWILISLSDHFHIELLSNASRSNIHLTWFLVTAYWLVWLTTFFHYSIQFLQGNLLLFLLSTKRSIYWKVLWDILRILSGRHFYVWWYGYILWMDRLIDANFLSLQDDLKPLKRLTEEDNGNKEQLKTSNLTLVIF